MHVDFNRRIRFYMQIETGFLFYQGLFQHKFPNQFTRINIYKVREGTNLDGEIKTRSG
jgi:hypothetical protein